MTARESPRIRAMTAGDLPRVTAIAADLKDAPHWTLTAWEAVLDPAGPRRIALVAEDAQTGTVQGFAVAAVQPPDAELESIAVTPERQRRGWGRRLFGALAGKLRRCGVAEVHLEVRASNEAAQALYARLGFAETGRRPHYYAAPEEDAVLLSLAFNKS
jgi:ribosomal-protein-alanine N-acetyltransferase